MSLWHAYYSVGTPSTGASPPAATAYADAVAALSPTAYWRLGDASGNATDSSGNGYTLTAGGSPTYSATGWTTDGDGAITFDADYFYAADAAWQDIGTADWSLAWVMKANGAPTETRQIIGHRGTGESGEWAVHLATSATLLVVRTGAAYNLFHSATLYDNAYHHCVLAVDRSGSAVFYVDGANVGTKDVSASVATDLTNAQQLWLGSRGGATPMNFVGTLDEVAFWNGTLLSSANVTTLYGAR